MDDTQLTFWRQPSLVAGLPRQQRRQATLDIRRGQPSPDPLLLAVEQIEVERLRGVRAMNRWMAPVLVVSLTYWGTRQVVGGDPQGYVGIAAATLMFVAMVWSVPYYRGMRAFA